MKRILLIFIVCCCILSSHAQIKGYNGFIYSDNSTNYKVISKIDTVELNKGDLSCVHIFVEKDKQPTANTCAVNHGELGCPDTWINTAVICQKCLRHLTIKEQRNIEEIKPSLTYSDLVKRIKK